MAAEFNRSFDVIGDEPRYLTAVLHPRTMQALLDARPVRLAIASTALVLSRDQAMTAESLTQGLATKIEVPQHVYDDWGQRAPEPGRGLRFLGRRFDPSPGAALLRMTTLATGILGLTLLTCLAAAATETGFDPLHSVGRLLIGSAVLARRVYGSAWA